MARNTSICDEFTTLSVGSGYIFVSYCLDSWSIHRCGLYGSPWSGASYLVKGFWWTYDLILGTPALRNASFSYEYLSNESPLAIGNSPKTSKTDSLTSNLWPYAANVSLVTRQWLLPTAITASTLYRLLISLRIYLILKRTPLVSNNNNKNLFDAGYRLQTSYTTHIPCVEAIQTLLRVT